MLFVFIFHTETHADIHKYMLTDLRENEIVTVCAPELFGASPRGPLLGKWGTAQQDTMKVLRALALHPGSCRAEGRRGRVPTTMAGHPPPPCVIPQKIVL